MQAIVKLFDIEDSVGQHRVSVEVVVPDTGFRRFFPDIGVHNDYQQAALWAVDSVAKWLLAAPSSHQRWQDELPAILSALAEHYNVLTF